MPCDSVPRRQQADTICLWHENTYKEVFPSHTVDRLLWLGRLIGASINLLMIHRR
jgi:hypothetical protein